VNIGHRNVSYTNVCHTKPTGTQKVLEGPPQADFGGLRRRQRLDQELVHGAGGFFR
jgi:hypothetical protein